MQEMVMVSNMIGAGMLYSKWEDIGIRLLSQFDLEIIKKDFAHNCVAATYKMYSIWLQRKIDATWNQFVEALLNSNLRVAAKELQEYLIKGTYM